MECSGVTQRIRPGFTGSGLDRADHLRLDEGRMDALANRAEARLMRLSGPAPELDEQGRLTWSSMADLPSATETIFLGLDGDVPLFAPLSAPGAGAPQPPMNLRLLGMMDPVDAAIWGCARSLLNWHGRHRFCANCGNPAALFRAGWARKCGSCESEHYPRVDPVVIMLAEYEGKVLIGRQPQFPAGRYSALAGFVEPGESIEEAVARELSEEAGVTVSDVRYVASQPWPFPGSLMIACIAVAANEALTIDRQELEDAKWVDAAGVRAALAGEPDAPFGAPPDYAIAHSLFVHWLQSV
jgi:NAD+ diphosphatase